MSTLDLLTTEAINPATTRIDAIGVTEALYLMNDEDQGVAAAVRAEIPGIAEVVDYVVESLRNGGRLIYVGAGTSGRLGCLDAAEIPPTFGAPPEMVVGVIAGGEAALRRSVEGAEDYPERGAVAMIELEVGSLDTVLGIAASGRTPYVIGALKEARRRGARTAGLTSNRPCELEMHCDALIAPVVGAEVISGSTRLKAGTSHKLVLNMITTVAMVRVGKTYGNLMVDVRPTNEKLRRRSERLVMLLAGCGREEAVRLLQSAGGETKVAIIAGLTGRSAAEAVGLLRAGEGRIRDALTAASVAAPEIGTEFGTADERR
jgi:N-acetylmuramic acid 6-phosphate etherase